MPDRILLILVDGLGWPPEPLAESAYAHCPALCHLLADHAVPIDACLDVPGIPQSATGQTTILTGRNAAGHLGQHLHGFPNAELRQLIEQENLFSQLLARGVPATFANAYALPPEQTIGMPVRSVTTVATHAAFGTTRSRADLLAGKAVYHDLHRRWLRERDTGDIPEIDEATAATHLLEIFRSVRFCLFEYFLTDLTAHRGTHDDQRAVLASLDRFLAALVPAIDPTRELLLLVSDHGNIEDRSTRHHTASPVPWCAIGCCEEQARADLRDLTGVTPRIIRLLEEEAPQSGGTNPVRRPPGAPRIEPAESG